MSVFNSLATKLKDGTRLPENTYPQGSENHQAYERCLQLEHDQPGPFEGVPESMIPPLISARVLGYGLLYAPNDTGRAALVRDILACQDQSELDVLAYLYVFGLIRVFFNPKGPTPAVTPAFTPRLPLETAAQTRFLESSSSGASKLHALALLRDDHRCIFTGKVDTDCYLRHLAANVVPSTNIDATNIAHIISQPLSEDVNGVTLTHRARFEWARTAGAMIERFGGFNAHDVLGDDNLHSPKNAFVSSTNPHMLFGRLDIWLMPATDAQGQVIPDTYDVEHSDGFAPALHAAQVSHRVIFRSLSVNDKTIPAPDHRIVGLHAACAKIAHMSGAVEHLHEFYRDTDDIAVMTQPNAAYELSRALRTLQVVSTTT